MVRNNKRLAVLPDVAVVLLITVGVLHIIAALSIRGSNMPLAITHMACGWLAPLAALGISAEDEIVGWRAGFLLAGGGLLVALLSHTIGFPDIPLGEWHLRSIATAIAESLFLICCFVAIHTATSQHDV